MKLKTLLDITTLKPLGLMLRQVTCSFSRQALVS